MQSHRRQLIAHVLPLLLFLTLLALCQLVTAHGHAFVLRHAEFWIYPTQTILCGALLLWFRRCYEFHRLKNVGFTLLIAFAVFVLWIAPQQFFHFAPRTIGFDPEILGKNPAVYWSTISFRFLRLVVVVPVMEEVFWRGFLLRFVIDEYFERVPFGKFTWPSFAIVALAFTFSHSRADWLAAFVAGALYNVIAYRTRSLASCVLAHAATNLLLGLWIMHTHQWGFW
jgi:CAAX prenyl protease-like protein